MIKRRKYDYAGNLKPGLFELLCDACGELMHSGKLVIKNGRVFEKCDNCILFKVPIKTENVKDSVSEDPVVSGSAL